MCMSFVWLSNCFVFSSRFCSNWSFTCSVILSFNSAVTSESISFLGSPLISPMIVFTISWTFCFYHWFFNFDETLLYCFSSSEKDSLSKDWSELLVLCFFVGSFSDTMVFLIPIGVDFRFSCTNLSPVVSFFVLHHVSRWPISHSERLSQIMSTKDALFKNFHVYLFRS